MTTPPTALNRSEWALFLDIDGTLLDIQPTPALVVSDSRLNQRLRSLHSQLNGAIALVSGRSITEIDRIFAPHQFPAAGGHGAEFRLDDKQQIAARLPTLPPASLRRAEELQATHTGLLLERKPHGVAMHYRGAPAAQSQVLAWAQQEIRHLGGTFRVLEGRMVYELIPTKVGKDTAIHELLGLDPFVDRKPIFIGDDVTDEAGFVLANNRHGLSVRVGTNHSSAATQQLENVAAVNAWLDQAFV
jgi:trehalose 6-phosphate phosphatase